MLRRFLVIPRPMRHFSRGTNLPWRKPHEYVFGFLATKGDTPLWSSTPVIKRDTPLWASDLEPKEEYPLWALWSPHGRVPPSVLRTLRGRGRPGRWLVQPFCAVSYDKFFERKNLTVSAPPVQRPRNETGA